MQIAYDLPDQTDSSFGEIVWLRARLFANDILGGKAGIEIKHVRGGRQAIAVASASPILFRKIHERLYREFSIQPGASQELVLKPWPHKLSAPQDTPFQDKWITNVVVYLQSQRFIEGTDFKTKAPNIYFTTRSLFQDVRYAIQSGKIRLPSPLATLAAFR